MTMPAGTPTSFSEAMQGASNPPKKRANSKQSGFLKVVNEIEADLRQGDQASPYFTLLRANYVDDLMCIERPHRGGSMLEIGGFPFYFSMCLRKLRGRPDDG
jgi:hypothetical protein